jgi:hypothetical protein
MSIPYFEKKYWIMPAVFAGQGRVADEWEALSVDTKVALLEPSISSSA